MLSTKCEHLASWFIRFSSQVLLKEHTDFLPFLQTQEEESTNSMRAVWQIILSGLQVLKFIKECQGVTREMLWPWFLFFPRILQILKVINWCYLLNKQHQSCPLIQLKFDFFSLVHKFIMKNTAVLLCSNIILQQGEKKTVPFKTTHQVLTVTKNNMRLRFEKGK